METKALPLCVMKFGGTSVGSVSAIQQVAAIVEGRSTVQRTLVVVSALSKVTDRLVEVIAQIRAEHFHGAQNAIGAIFETHRTVAAELGVTTETKVFFAENEAALRQICTALQVIGEPTKKTEDAILSVGEILSSHLVESYLRARGLPCAHVDPRHLLRTDTTWGEAVPDHGATRENLEMHCRARLSAGEIVLTGGYVGSSARGTTTLGRGGGDYSGAIFAAALRADALEIWTDVDGILTADPRVVRQSVHVPRLSYVEAAELAYFGAKVLHPKTIHPAVSDRIPVWVKNTFRPQHQGTMILEADGTRPGIKAIAFRRGVTVININSNRMLGTWGFLSRVFRIFEENRTSVDLVTTSEVSISLTIDNAMHLESIVEALTEFAHVNVRGQQAIISAVGEGIRAATDVPARYFRALTGINVTMVSLGSSEVNLSSVVAEVDLEEAVELLHAEFFGPRIMPELSLSRLVGIDSGPKSVPFPH